MATGESAGAVYVSIDVDASPLIAKYAQAEAQSRAAGQKIASALGQGMQQGSGLVDQFGHSLQSAVAPAEQVAAAVKQVAAAAASSVAPVEAATSGVRQMGSAMRGSTQEARLIGSSLRAMQGTGVLAAERLLSSWGPVASFFETAFPIFGLIALFEMVKNVIGKFGELTEAEKKNQEETKHLSTEWDNLAQKFESGEIERATLEIGKLAGLKLTSFYSDADADRDRAKLAELTRQLAEHTAAVAADASAAAASRNPLVAAVQGVDPVSTVKRFLATEDWKSQAQSVTDLGNQVSLLTEKLNVYDTVTKKVNADKIGKQQDEDTAKSAEDRKRQAAEAAAEEKRQAAEAAREQRAVIQGVSFSRRQAAEEEKKTQDDNQRDMLAGLREGSAESGRFMDEQRRALQALTAEANRRGDEGIKSAGIRQSSNDEIAKLQLQQNYSLQIVHSKQDELNYATQIAAADELSLQHRIDELQELKLYETLTGQTNAAEETGRQIEEARAALRKQEIQDQTKIASLAAQQSLAVQIQGAVGKGPGTLLDARNVVVANTMGNAVNGISSALGRAVQGGQKLSQVFSQLGRSILGSVVQGIAKIGLQMVVNAAIGKAATTAMAVSQAAAASGVGAAWAFASVLAALPFPANVAAAPGVAGAEAAQILAIGIPKFDKGGFIPHDMMAMVHKGEYVLTADQVAGKSAIPNIPASGGIGSHPLTASSSVSNASVGLTVGAIHLHGVRDMRDVARRLPALIKATAPSFSPATR